MPRFVINDSEDESEPKTAGRKTRLASAVTATDSPVRRSTRIRRGSVNPDGSSPESVTGVAGTVTRATRRRAAATNVETAVPEPVKNLRSRKNSVSSNVSDLLESESNPATPKARSYNRRSIVDDAPEESKPKTRRGTRATSESKSPPSTRTTRRTRATSIDPEPIIEQPTKRVTQAATPTKRRRTLVSVLPTEPDLPEETIEDKMDDVSEEMEIQDSTGNRRSSFGKTQSLSKNEISIQQSTNLSNTSPSGKSPSGSSDISLLKDDVSNTETAEVTSNEESALLKSPRRSQSGDSDSIMNGVGNSATRIKQHSTDRSKELGIEIEDLLNKSTEEQESSPGNKENQKVNVAPEKIRKNLEFTVSNMNVVRRHNSAQSLIKSPDKKTDFGSDERVLSKSRHTIGAISSTYLVPTTNYRRKSRKSIDADDDQSVSSPLGVQKFTPEKKSSPRMSPRIIHDSSVLGDEMQERNKELSDVERRSSKTSSYVKLDETVVENEIIEEFKLYHSGDSSDDGMKDDDDNGCVVKTSEGDSSFTKSKKITLEQSCDTNAVTNSGETFEKSTPKSQFSKKVDREEIEKGKGKSPSVMLVPLKRVNSPIKSNLNLSLNKSECKDPRSPQPPEPQTQIQTNSENEISQEKCSSDADECEEAMEQSVDTNNASVSLSENQFSKQCELSVDSQDNISNTETQNRDSDSNLAVDDLFQDISAEEWNKRHKNRGSQHRRSLSNKSLPAEVPSPSPSKKVSPIQTEFNTELSPGTKRSPKKSPDEKYNQLKDFLDGDSSSSTSMTLKIDDPIPTEGEDIVSKRNSLRGKIIPVPETEDSDMNKMITGKKVSPARRKSVDVSAKSNMSQNFIELCDAESEDGSLPTNTDILEDSNTLKSKKKSSPFKSTPKSVEAEDVDALAHSSESEDKDKRTNSSNSKRRSLRKKKDDMSSARTPITRNCSIMAVADSDSASGNLTDPDCSNSADNNSHLMPSFLFNVNTSDEEDDSQNSIDPDVANDLNLAGDDDIEYSDDNVPADDCRASESEHSDMDDDGSDLDDFIVDDNEVESSNDSEDEENDVETKDATTSKRKRILEPIESDNEDEAKETASDPDEEADVDDLEISKNTSNSEKKKRKSLNKTDNSNSSNTSEELLMQFSQSTSPKKVSSKLNFSLDSNKTSSSTKSSKRNSIGDSQSKLDHSFGDLENKSDKKLKKKSKKSLLDVTIDLCTPNSQESGKSLPFDPDSFVNSKTSKKLRKALVEDLEALTPEKTGADEQLTTPGKTPKKDKRSLKEITPKLAEQKNRDSIQIIREIETMKTKITGRNRSLDPPNSESPVTKFLRKEKLNESLPVLELGKKTKKLVDRQKLDEMNEDGQEDDDDSRTENDEDIADNHENNEGASDEKDYDTTESNDDEVAGDKSDQNDDKDGETDEEPDGIDKNSDDDKEDETGSLDEEDEPSEEDHDVIESEARVKRQSGTPGLKNGSTESPGSIKLADDEKSPRKKRSITNQSKASGSILLDEKQNESDETSIDPKKRRSLPSPATNLLNERKRSRLEDGSTPAGLVKTKKMRTLSQKNTSQENSSDSDEGPEVVGFSEARTVALEAMKNVADSLQAAKEARKQKRKDRLEKVRKQQEAKAEKLSKQQETTKLKTEKDKLKRLPDNVLENLSDAHQGPTKKRKLLKKEEPTLCPSKYQFSPGKPTKPIKVKTKVLPLSTVGSTTQFSVVNLKKVETRPKKVAAVASFRDKMLARNPREAASAYLVHQAKLKAAGKNLITQKKAWN